MGKKQKRQYQNASRRKETLVNKAFEYGELYSAGVALIIYQNGRYFIYRSIDKPSFPPAMDVIMHSYPIPKILRPTKSLTEKTSEGLARRQAEALDDRCQSGSFNGARIE
ncbi:hypothetical protein VE00_09469 [Pseudogymnoascus sp. WSF 3629]|nr:hypothetical protein VE00_09469 [Pseudogymnoascus sp. WSF 3629]